MRDLEAASRSLRVAIGIERSSLGRSIDGEPMTPEDEDVEVDLAWTPALTSSTPKRALDVLEVHEQAEGRRLRFVMVRRHVEGNHRVAELGLVRDAHRSRRIEAGHAAQANAGKACQRTHRGRQRHIGIADICSQADVGPDRPAQRAALPSIDSVP